MYCIGVSNHSPEQVAIFLRKKKVIADVSDIHIVPVGTKLTQKKRSSKNHIFLVNISDFLRNAEILNSNRYDGKAVFIFSSAIRLNELVDIYAWDYEALPDKPGFRMFKLELSRYRQAIKKDVNTVRRNSDKYLTVLTDKIKAGSLLTPLMTFIYTLPSATHQAPIKRAIADYLYNGKSFKALEKEFDKLDLSLSSKARDKLKEILLSEVGENYRSAFREIRQSKEDGKAKPIQRICRTHGTSDYEINYIRSIVEDSKISAKYRSVAT